MSGGDLSDARVSDVRFVDARDSEMRTGLVGWVSCILNRAVYVDGIALRRTAAGRFTLSFPCRRDGSGRRRPVLRPVDDLARRTFEAQVFAALGIEEEAAR